MDICTMAGPILGSSDTYRDAVIEVDFDPTRCGISVGRPNVCPIMGIVSWPITARRSRLFLSLRNQLVQEVVPEPVTG